MSRKLLVFLLSELRTVRVICKNPTCEGVVEIPVERLGAKTFDARCRLCNHQFAVIHKQDDNPFAMLAAAVERLQRNAEYVDVEFVLPDEGK